MLAAAGPVRLAGRGLHRRRQARHAKGVLRVARLHHECDRRAIGRVLSDRREIRAGENRTHPGLGREMRGNGLDAVGVVGMHVDEGRGAVCRDHHVAAFGPVLQAGPRPGTLDVDDLGDRLMAVVGADGKQDVLTRGHALRDRVDDGAGKGIGCVEDRQVLR